MAARKRIYYILVSLPCFLSSPFPLRLYNDPQWRDDDTVALLWPFRIMKNDVFAIIRVMRSYVHARICRLMNN